MKISKIGVYLGQGKWHNFMSEGKAARVGRDAAAA